MPGFLAGVKRSALYIVWSQEGQNGTEQNGMATNTKLRITHSFIWTVPPNYEKTISQGRQKEGIKVIKG